jgi:two-component system sensor histidine kinase KdpD
VASTDPALTDVELNLAHARGAWTVDETLEDGAHLFMEGPEPEAKERRVISAFAAHATVLLGREQLAKAAKQASGLARDNAARTTLLAAVSHDLRTPLSSIKAGVSMLRQSGVELTAQDQAELLESVEESADRLDALIGNLLDLSRLQTGTVRAHTEVADVDDAVRATVCTVSSPNEVEVDIAPGLATARADLGLLDRVLANVIENALRHSGGEPVRVTADHFDDRVEIRVTDRGPGVDDSDKERIFAAFQRVGDAPQGEGLGLGLAVARGLTEVMSGTLAAEDTPGGGLTMVIALPVAKEDA